jgi:hypothetical protein
MRESTASILTKPRRPATPSVARITLKPLENESRPSNSLKATVPSLEPSTNIHVLTLLPDADLSQNSFNKVEEQLKGLEKFIGQQCPYSDSKAYKTCEVATRAEVHEHLESMAIRVNKLDDSRIRTLYEEAIELYNYAETVFELFLPVTFDGPTTRKYWGAIKLLTLVSWPFSSVNKMKEADKAFEDP